MEKGFFMIPRSLFDDFYFDQKPFCRRGFVTYLCEIAIYKPQYREFNGVEIWLEKGDVAISLRELQSVTGWSTKKISTCLKRLEKGNTIRRKRETPITVFNVTCLKGSEGSSETKGNKKETVTTTQPNKVNKVINKKDHSRVEKKPSTTTSHIFIEQAKGLVEFLNDLTGKHFRPVPATIKPIVARLKEGNSEQQCRTLIARMHTEWEKDPVMNKHLRPSTLFRPSNFENYLGLCNLEEME